ncbi:unnamed protein product [Strongylus vulgaris]|uniref:GPI inositol-deacylase n=1 Tax=Strongylus vulgaris TaxID=40348 RepID=A0A3P7LM64_STRVU|nr:unnamed protein product [Strongylus vulgaris]
MMNKTEMTSAPFRMHFYAVDFNEELSFISGSILNRQRNFVVSAISTVQRMYSRKIVLIGHSFGGVVLYALPAHPRYNVSDMGLVLTLAAPILSSPIVMDESMVNFYETMQNNDHAVHRPSWSIRGVDAEADHLCILWCNELVRHSTRILYRYGMEDISPHPRPPVDVVRDFFYKEKGSGSDIGGSTSNIVKIGIFDYPWVSRAYKGSMEVTLTI